MFIWSVLQGIDGNQIVSTWGYSCFIFSLLCLAFVCMVWGLFFLFLCCCGLNFILFWFFFFLRKYTQVNVKTTYGIYDPRWILTLLSLAIYNLLSDKEQMDKIRTFLSNPKKFWSGMYLYCKWWKQKRGWGSPDHSLILNLLLMDACLCAALRCTQGS